MTLTDTQQEHLMTTTTEPVAETLIRAAGDGAANRADGWRRTAQATFGAGMSVLVTAWPVGQTRPDAAAILVAGAAVLTAGALVEAVVANTIQRQAAGQGGAV